MAILEQDVANQIQQTNKKLGKPSSLYFFVKSLIAEKDPLLAPYPIYEISTKTAFLIEFNPSAITDIIHKQERFKAEKYHIRVDQYAYLSTKSNKAREGLSPSHISIHLRSDTKKALIIHLYYDATGNLLSIRAKTDICFEDESKESFSDFDIDNSIVTKFINEVEEAYKLLNRLIEKKAKAYLELLKKSNELQLSLELLSMTIHEEGTRNRYYETAESFYKIIDNLNKLQDIERDYRDMFVRQFVKEWRAEFDQSISEQEEATSGTKVPDTTPQTLQPMDTPSSTITTVKSKIKHSPAEREEKLRATLINLRDQFNQHWDKLDIQWLNTFINAAEDLLNPKKRKILDQIANPIFKYSAEQASLALSAYKLANSLHFSSQLTRARVSQSTALTGEAVLLDKKVANLKKFINNLFYVSGFIGDYDTFCQLFETEKNRVNPRFFHYLLSLLVLNKSSDPPAQVRICQILYDRSDVYRACITEFSQLHFEDTTNQFFINFLGDAILKKNWVAFTTLLNHGWNVNVPVIYCRKSYLTPLLATIRLTDDPKFTQKLIQHGALVNDRRQILLVIKDFTSIPEDLSEFTISTMVSRSKKKAKSRQQSLFQELEPKPEIERDIKKLFATQSDLEAILFQNRLDLIPDFINYCNFEQLVRCLGYATFFLTSVDRTFLFPASLSAIRCFQNKQDMMHGVSATTMATRSEPQILDNLQLLLYGIDSASALMPYIRLLVEKFQNCAQSKELLASTIEVFVKLSQESLSSTRSNDADTVWDCVNYLAGVCLLIQKGNLSVSDSNRLLWFLSTFAHKAPVDESIKLFYFKVADNFANHSKFSAALKSTKMYNFIERQIKALESKVSNEEKLAQSRAILARYSSNSPPETSASNPRKNFPKR